MGLDPWIFIRKYLYGFIFTTIAVFIVFAFSTSIRWQGLLLLAFSLPCYSVRPIITKKIFAISDSIDVVTLTFTILLFSMIIFFVLSIAYYGIYHFSDVLYPKLWHLIGAYAFFCVFLSKIFWNFSLKHTSNRLIVSSKYIVSFLTAAWAFVLLKEFPSRVEIIAFIISMVAILISHFNTFDYFNKTNSPERQLNCDG